MTGRWWQQAVGYEVYVSSFADADRRVLRPDEAVWATVPVTGPVGAA